MVFLHERLAAQQFIGFAMIALGLAFIDGRLPRVLLGAISNLARRYPQLPTGQKSR